MFVVEKKAKAGELTFSVGALQQKLNNGKTVSDTVFDDTELPWWTVLWDWMVAFIEEHWDEILKFLLTLITLDEKENAS